MRYMLMDFVSEAGWNELSTSERNEWLGAYIDYMDTMKRAGILLNGCALQPASTATTVRMEDGEARVLDGPYTDSKEQLGGFHIIEAPDLDSALSWAKRSPTARHGAVEVRPLATRDLSDIRAELAKAVRANA